MIQTGLGAGGLSMFANRKPVIQGFQQHAEAINVEAKYKSSSAKTYTHTHSQGN